MSAKGREEPQKGTFGSGSRRCQGVLCMCVVVVLVSSTHQTRPYPCCSVGGMLFAYWVFVVLVCCCCLVVWYLLCCLDLSCLVLSRTALCCVVLCCVVLCRCLVLSCLVLSCLCVVLCCANDTPYPLPPHKPNPDPDTFIVMYVRGPHVRQRRVGRSCYRRW